MKKERKNVSIHSNTDKKNVQQQRGFILHSDMSHFRIVTWMDEYTEIQWIQM